MHTHTHTPRYSEEGNWRVPGTHCENPAPLSLCHPPPPDLTATSSPKPWLLRVRPLLLCSAKRRCPGRARPPWASAPTLLVIEHLGAQPWSRTRALGSPRLHTPQTGVARTPIPVTRESSCCSDFLSPQNLRDLTPAFSALLLPQSKPFSPLAQVRVVI